MVRRGEGEFRSADFAIGKSHAVKRLRAGDFVHQVTVDVEQCGFVSLADDMTRPDFVEQCGGHVRHDLPGSFHGLQMAFRMGCCLDNNIFHSRAATFHSTKADALRFEIPKSINHSEM